MSVRSYEQKTIKKNFALLKSLMWSLDMFDEEVTTIMIKFTNQSELNSAILIMRDVYQSYPFLLFTNYVVYSSVLESQCCYLQLFSIM